MPIKTRRWNEPVEPDDGLRLLICRYRPRGIASEAETWHAWEPALAPSKALHRAVYTESASPLPWPAYQRKYVEEMRSQKPVIASLAARVKAGETITLLCSSACMREARCHRSILRDMIEQAIAAAGEEPPVPS
jgi:uncharacterized protein YeaO (DUF488 family)